jgi:hypothetical protein
MHNKRLKAIGILSCVVGWGFGNEEIEFDSGFIYK